MMEIRFTVINGAGDLARDFRIKGHRAKCYRDVVVLEKCELTVEEVRRFAEMRGYLIAGKIAFESKDFCEV